MKWKDNLIYEFINQIISFKWILKPETLWWLNRRGKVFSLPCVKRIVFLWSGFGQESGTRTSSLRSARGTHCLLGMGRESLPPRPSSSRVLSSPRSDGSYLLPGDPTGDIAWRRPPKELPVLSSQMQTEGQACAYLDWMQDFCSKTSRPSSQAVLQATSTSFLEVRRVGCRSGVFFLFILRALSGVRTVRGQVPAEPRRMPEACGKPCGCLSERTHVCCTILQFSPWGWICWIWMDSGALLDRSW